MLDAVNSWLTRAKRSQRVVPVGKPVKVNIGSYLVVQEGWINVEGTIHAFLAGKGSWVAKWMYRFSKAREVVRTEGDYVAILKNHKFVHHDLQYGLPFFDNSVDFLYSSHVLEHLYPNVAELLLREAHRVLRPGGTIRVCVPDLEYAFALCRAGRKQQALAYFFQDANVADFHRHKYMYDFDLLSSALQTAGFPSVRRCRFREGSVPDIEHLDNRPEETLFVEATKLQKNGLSVIAQNNAFVDQHSCVEV
jgi:SAM-dependent methyltransferase